MTIRFLLHCIRNSSHQTTTFFTHECLRLHGSGSDTSRWDESRPRERDSAGTMQSEPPKPGIRCCMTIRFLLHSIRNSSHQTTTFFTHECLRLDRKSVV